MLYLLIWIYPSVWCSHSKIRADQPRLLKAWASAVSHAFVWSTFQSRVNQPLFSIDPRGNKNMPQSNNNNFSHGGSWLIPWSLLCCYSLRTTSYGLTDSSLRIFLHNNRQLDIIFCHEQNYFCMSTHNSVGSFINVIQGTLKRCSGISGIFFVLINVPVWKDLLGCGQQLQLPTILCFHIDHCQAC